MKYLLLIYQGDAPTPADPEAWGKLSEDEQNAVYAAYGEINTNPNITPGVGMRSPRPATTSGSTTARRSPPTARSPSSRRRSAASSSSRPTTSTPPSRSPRRSPPRAWAAPIEVRLSWSASASSTSRTGLPRSVGPCPRCPDRLPRRLRPRRGGRAGGVRGRGGALAARRRAGEPGRWLVTTARNRAIDRIRRDRTLAAKTRLLEMPEAAEDDDGRRDVQGRAAGAHLHLLPPGAGDRCAGRAHAAHARRADDARRSRARFLVPRRRWPSGSSGPSARSRPPGSRSACRPTTSCRTASPRCSRSST